MLTMLEPRLEIVKYHPLWVKKVERDNPKIKTNPVPKILGNSELMVKLNEIAKGYPFCVMYHTKRNDPL